MYIYLWESWIFCPLKKSILDLLKEKGKSFSDFEKLSPEDLSKLFEAKKEESVAINPQEDFDI